MLNIFRRESQQVEFHVENAINFVREQLSVKVAQIFEYRISYGVFKGMNIVPEFTWNKADVGAMILGLYEKEVIQVLEKNPGSTLINLGAGDGYYAIGGVVSGLFQNSIAFEMNPNSRKVIREGLKLNSATNKVRILGEAHKDFWKSLQLPPEMLHGCLVLSDIEGGEFEIFDRPAFEYFKSSIIIIEIHDWVAEGSEKLKDLVFSSEKTHRAEEIRTTGRDLSAIPEVATFSDSDRWLLCSEGRPILMRWLVFYPLES
jgi:hypothetical protein